MLKLLKSLLKISSNYINYLTQLYLITKISLLQFFKKYYTHDSELKAQLLTTFYFETDNQIKNMNVIIKQYL